MDDQEIHKHSYDFYVGYLVAHMKNLSVSEEKTLEENLRLMTKEQLGGLYLDCRG